MLKTIVQSGFAPTLLVVDDEPFILSAIRRLLRNESYRVLTAVSASDGLAMLARYPVQVVLTDQQMPGMVGTAFLERVMASYPDTVRILLSGHADGLLVRCALDSGVLHDFLRKPWDDDVLRSRLREAFTRYPSTVGNFPVEATYGPDTAKSNGNRAENSAWLFARTIHDLRQPLAALQICVRLVERPDGKLSIDAATLRTMAECIEESKLLLSQLHDLTRLEWGLVNPNLTEFRVGEVLHRVVSERADAAKAKGLRLRCVSSGLIANTDEELFRCCVAYLVDHTLRRTEPGGVLVGCRRRRGGIRVEIWDTGHGSPGETFEEFANTGRAPALGLAIVAKTAALLGFHVNVRSRPGKGCVFSLELPLGRGVEDSVSKRGDVADARP